MSSREPDGADGAGAINGWELVGVPYTSMRQPGGIAEAIGSLRASGLAERLAELGVTDAGDLDLEEPCGERGPSGLLNERALSRLVDATRQSVSVALRRGRLPLLVGGDCPVLLGPLAALKEGSDDVGLVMIDGHEDSWPPALSETGEASDSELAIALGLASVQLPPPLDRLVPLVDPSRVALLGPRDSKEIAAAGVRSISGEVAFFSDDLGIDSNDPARTVGAALEANDATAFWLHVDLDVLASEDFAAVDYRQTGGLAWEQLDRLAQAAAASPRCRGMSVVIYNPDLDPDGRAAAQVVDFIVRVIEQCSPATPTR